jgi:hypothetical protein
VYLLILRRSRRSAQELGTWNVRKGVPRVLSWVLFAGIAASASTVRSIAYLLFAWHLSRSHGSDGLRMLRYVARPAGLPRRST